MIAPPPLAVQLDVQLLDVSQFELDLSHLHLDDAHDEFLNLVFVLIRQQFRLDRGGAGPAARRRGISADTAGAGPKSSSSSSSIPCLRRPRPSPRRRVSPRSPPSPSRRCPRRRRPPPRRLSSAAERWRRRRAAAAATRGPTHVAKNATFAITGLGAPASGVTISSFAAAFGSGTPSAPTPDDFVVERFPSVSRLPAPRARPRITSSTNASSMGRRTNRRTHSSAVFVSA